MKLSSILSPLDQIREIREAIRIASILSPLDQIREAIRIAFFPTLREVLRRPSLLLRPRALSQLFMSHVWDVFGRGMDLNAAAIKEHLITPHAHGVVLDIGAGHGHTVKYLDRERVTTYVALEPNTYMHAQLRATAAAAGYTEADGSLCVLSCGAEDVRAIAAATGGLQRVDTLVSVLTLCSVPAPAATLAALAQCVLRPGGTLLYYEHVLNPRPDVARWQRVWTPLWVRFFDGCTLDRPTDRYIREATEWSEAAEWGEEGESEEHLFWHSIGRFVKAGAVEDVQKDVVDKTDWNSEKDWVDI